MTSSAAALPACAGCLPCPPTPADSPGCVWPLAAIAHTFPVDRDSPAAPSERPASDMPLRGSRWPPRLKRRVSSVLVVSAALMNSNNQVRCGAQALTPGQAVWPHGAAAGSQRAWPPPVCSPSPHPVRHAPRCSPAAQVLLGRRSKGSRRFRGLYEFPGGKVGVGVGVGVCLPPCCHSAGCTLLPWRPVRALAMPACMLGSNPGRSTHGLNGFICKPEAFILATFPLHRWRLERSHSTRCSASCMRSWVWR